MAPPLFKSPEHLDIRIHSFQHTHTGTHTQTRTHACTHTHRHLHTHTHTHTHRVLHYNCFIQDSVVSSFLLLLLLLLPAPSSDLILLYHKDKTWLWSCSVSVNTDVRESSPGHSLWRHASPPVHLQRLRWLPAPRPGGVHGRPAAAHATCVHHLRKQGQGLLDRIWLYCMRVCEYIHAHMHHVYTSELDSSKGGGGGVLGPLCTAGLLVTLPHCYQAESVPIEEVSEFCPQKSVLSWRQSEK